MVTGRAGEGDLEAEADEDILMTTIQLLKVNSQNEKIESFQFFFQRMDFRDDIGWDLAELNQFLHCMKCIQCIQCMVLVLHAAANGDFTWFNVRATPFV